VKNKEYEILRIIYVTCKEKMKRFQVYLVKKKVPYSPALLWMETTFEVNRDVLTIL